MAADTSAYGLVLSTCPDADTAARIATTRVEGRLAACANVIPGLRSFYRWQGRVECDQEQLLMAKTHRTRYADLEPAIRAQHPYELPEILYVAFASGLEEYLTWIARSVDVAP